MKKSFFIFVATALSLSSVAYAARQTFTVLINNGNVANYCSDESGIHVNPDGSGYLTGATEGPCTVTPPPPPPNFVQQLTATITYAHHPVANVDLTLWKNIVGRIQAVSQVTEWPYASGSTPSFTILPNRVIAAKMIVPANADQAMHPIKNVSYFGSPGVTVSASTIPGDFNPSQAACVKHNAVNNDAPMIYVRAGGNLNSAVCRLTPGSVYYINLKFENPAQGGQVTLTWY